MQAKPAGRGTLLAALTMVAVTACGGGDDPVADPTTAAPTAPAPTEEPTPSPTPTKEPSPTPTPTPEEPEVDATSEAGVIAGYIEALEASIAAFNPPDPEDPGLLAHHDGEVLDILLDQIHELIDEGHSEEVELGYHPEVREIDPDGTAVVDDCLEVTIRTVDTKTGEQVGDVTDEVRNYRSYLELRDDTWLWVKTDVRNETCTPEG